MLGTPLNFNEVFLTIQIEKTCNGTKEFQISVAKLKHIPPVCLRVYNGKGAEREEMLLFICLDVKENKKEWKGEKHVISLTFYSCFYYIGVKMLFPLN